MDYFSRLNYSLGDEDTLAEYQILPEGVNHVVAVAGSGGRVVPLIARRPKVITCVDILADQLDLTELRVEAIRNLSYQDFMSLLGYPEFPISSKYRSELFMSLKLSPETTSRLQARFEKANWGPIIYLGEFEKMLIKVSKLIKLVIGKNLDILFSFTDLDEQRAYINSSNFPHARWKLALLLFGNATALNAILYKGDFPVKNQSGSTYSIYKEMFNTLFQEVLCRESYFFQMLILGKLIHSNDAVMEADEDIFRKMKKYVSKIKINYLQLDIVSAIETIEEKVDFVSISDVPSFMTDNQAHYYLTNISTNLASGARVVSRGHLRVITPDNNGYTEQTSNLQHLYLPERTCLWTIKCYEKI